jgi:hypothetical protein
MPAALPRRIVRRKNKIQSPVAALLTWRERKLGSLRMRPRRRTAIHVETSRFVATLIALAWLTMAARADSFPTFSVLFAQITNDIALIEQNFDNSSTQKQTLATLTLARTAILDPELRDEQVLSSVVNLLESDINYAATLDFSAQNARATVLARYELLATRVADLPPSTRTSAARNLFNDLTADKNALANAEHAAGIAQLLAPFGRRLETLATIVDRAQTMTKPRVGSNAVRVMIDNHRFTSGGNGRHSPNIFEVTAPTPRYLAVSCRVVDRDEVISFSLPVLTDQVRYEVAQGLVTLAYNPAVFDTNVTLVATNGTFFVQAVKKEIYGIFSCEGPGFAMKEGRFRIEIPRALREK